MQKNQPTHYWKKKSCSSDVEALIGKRPFEEKKPLVDEMPIADVVEGTVAQAEPKAEDEKATGEQTGTIGLAPSI